MKTEPEGTPREETDTNGVRATLTALRAAVADETKYARQWCTERRGAAEVENGRLCLCSRLLRLKVDPKRYRAALNALLEYTTDRDPCRTVYARLHDIAPDHAAALRLIDHALKDRNPGVTHAAA